MKHTDPVCNMQVEESTPFKSQRGERAVYFCSAQCKSAYDKAPEQFEKGAKQRSF